MYWDHCSPPTGPLISWWMDVQDHFSPPFLGGWMSTTICHHLEDHRSMILFWLFGDGTLFVLWDATINATVNWVPLTFYQSLFIPPASGWRLTPSGPNPGSLLFINRRDPGLGPEGVSRHPEAGGILELLVVRHFFKLANSFQVQVGALFHVSALFQSRRALFPVELAHLFKCVYIYMYINIFTYIYIQIYTHTYVYLYVYICIYNYIHVFAHLHMYTHTRTHVYAQTHTHGRGKETCFYWIRKKFCAASNPLWNIKLLTLCPSWSLLVCVSSFLVCCRMKSAWIRSRWTEASVRLNHFYPYVIKYGQVGSMTTIFWSLWPLQRSVSTNLFLHESNATFDIDRFFSTMNPIDHRYWPYSPVGGIKLTVDIDPILPWD